MRLDNLASLSEAKDLCISLPRHSAHGHFLQILRDLNIPA